jgi:hypothetical protein
MRIEQLTIPLLAGAAHEFLLQKVCILIKQTTRQATSCLSGVLVRK